MIERLEFRRLLAAQLEGGLLTVTGTDGHDNLRLFINSGDLVVDENGDETRFPNSDVEQIFINAGDGDDQVLLFPEVRGATIEGGGGSDTLVGGDADDLLDGGGGDDHLDGKLGADVIVGGNGFDSADYRFREEDLVLSIDDQPDDGADNGNEGDNIREDVERIVGGSGNDRIVGSPADNSIDARNGNDTVLAGQGNDSIDGGDGQDSLAGGPGNDRLRGQADADELFGGDDDDSFDSQDGTRDIVDGGSGSDTVTDGDAQDEFRDVEDIPAGARPPEISVRRNKDNIDDGQTTVGFGTHNEGDKGTVRTFTVTNTGGGALTLGNVQVPAGYVLVENLPNSLGPDESTTFVIRIDTSSPGDKEGQVSFSNNDPNEDPFNFFVSGRVNAAPARNPEIVVIRGDEPVSDDKTVVDFGNATQGGAPKTRTFTVRNTGNGNLTLGNVQVPAGYSLVEGLANQLGPDESDTFTVRMDSAQAGTKDGEVLFTNNDDDENPFNIKVTGVVRPPKTPEIAVFLGQTAIDDGGGKISFKNTRVGGKERSLTFTVRNTGDAPLDLGKLRVPSGYRIDEGLSSRIQPGESDTFKVTLKSGSPGTKSGQITFPTNDPNEDPFNFAITGRVTAPDIAVRWGKRTITDGDKNAVDFGTVGGGSGVRTQVFRVTNVGDATLSLGKIKLPAGYSVTNRLSSELAPGQSDTFTVALDGRAGAGTHAGRIKIATNDPDEESFDFAVTGRVLGVSASVDGSGSLVVTGTGGHDVIEITAGSGSTSSVRVRSNGSSQSFSGVKRIFVNANDGDDKVTVSASIAASINGGNGNDTLVGGKRGDTLTGEAGNDRLTGGLGSDWLLGGDGKDILSAQDGVADRKVDGGPGSDKVTTDPTDNKTGT